MNTIDEENLEIQVSETLSFEHEVSPRLEGMKDDIEYAFGKGEYEKSREDVQRFLQYTLTQEDRVKILQNIVENYEQASIWNYYAVTIFDEDIIRRGINQWIEEKFNF